MKFLKKAYNREDYLNFLKDKFNFSQLIQTKSIGNDDVESFEQLGFITTIDDNKLPVFEIDIKPNTKLERNRVGLRHLVAQQVGSNEGALAVFVDDNNSQWRFSFIAIEYSLTERGVEKEQTASKRFTYLFGEGAKTRTAENRFSKLGKQSTLKDLKVAFAVEALNKEFYDKLYNWYLNAQQQVKFPNDENAENAENHTQTNLIRFLTRILFVWFLKEKKLINLDLFDLDKLQNLIDYEKNSSFYKAILQNLFFATLNRQITDRSFRTTTNGKANKTNYLATNIYRYQDFFKDNDEQQIMALFSQTPFLNGGLFECLDREATDEEKQQYEQNKNSRKVGSAIRVDGFSDRTDNELKFDNQLLFNDDEQDLGLISLFEQYQFTVEESTPADVEVALDPELLGKVFENLLATYNPETGEQARKATGSFYTPREIVSYMVDESLKQHFKTHTDLDKNQTDALFVEGKNTLKPTQIKEVIKAINNLKILDPAVGSGAYPMGILQRLVFILDKIDPENIYFKQQQLDKAEKMEATSKQASIEVIEQIFSKANQHNTYGKKLTLIENCIYGVDIQPIAIQICKLRFFISLTIEQKPNSNKDSNYGIKALPNLETKFIVANTLLPLGEKPQQAGLFDTDINNLKLRLAEVRHQYFSAKTLKTKRKYREQDRQLRQQMLETLKQSGISPAVETSMKKVVAWDLYNQNSQSNWFDPEWMFGVKKGFDIVIGNPPYIDSELMVKNDKKIRENISRSYLMTKGNWDIYIAFFEFGFNSLNSDGVLTFITPDKWLAKPFGYELRKKLMDNLRIILNSGRQVFETAKVDSIVTFFTKKHCDSLLVLNFKDNKILLKDKIIKSNINEPFSFDFVFSNHLLFLNKIDLLSLKVGDFFECENACATSDAYKLKDFIKNNVGSVGENYLKIINTGTIGKYVSKWGTKEMTYLGNKYLNPIVKKGDFLEQFGNSYSKKSIKPKIIIKGLTLLDSCLDEKGIFIPGKSTLIVANDNIEELKFLLGLLNSKLVIFYIKEKHPASSYNQGINFTKHMINNMPIPKISKLAQKPFIDLVDKIIQAKQDGKDTTTLETKIDEMVYQLYDLTADEIDIIETSK
uniref:Eco57I restriction-modification methylase domain-containing protein n=1 Tax=Candidatus Thiodubiliella endoseptemdiera TaxID=2738886 RepID=UPI0034DEB738